MAGLDVARLPDLPAEWFKQRQILGPHRSDPPATVRIPPVAAGIGPYRCMINVPLHDKHVFDTHVLAARRAGLNGSWPGSSGMMEPTKTLPPAPRWGFYPGNPRFSWFSVTAGRDAEMNAYQINKVLGLVLGTLLVLQTVRILDGSFTPGKVVAAKEEQPAGAKGEAAAGAQSINGLLGGASAEHGAQIAKQCEICHNFQEGQGAKVGPDLYGVVDRPVASVEGFNYTAALKAKGGKWTFAELNKWLTDPRADVPGTAMTFAGLSSEKQRADVIAYLDSLSKNPVPLPKAQ
jgi:cytochrome c